MSGVACGDRVAVQVRAHGPTPGHVALWRAVGVARGGKVTHVAPPQAWARGATANAGTALGHQSVDRVWVGVPRDTRLGVLDGAHYDDVDELTAAIRATLAETAP